MFKILKIHMAGLFALLVLFSVISPAYAQEVCGEHSKFVDHLASQYKEAPQAMGLGSYGGMFEVFVSEEGTWTILRTLPNGYSCVVAAGENWESFPALTFGPVA